MTNFILISFLSTHILLTHVLSIQSSSFFIICWSCCQPADAKRSSWACIFWPECTVQSTDCNFLTVIPPYKDDCKLMYSCEYFRTKPKFMFFFSNPNSKTISFIEINNLIKNLLMLLLIKLSQNTRTLIFCQTSKNVGSYCITCHFSTCTCICYKWSGVKTHQITFLLHVPYCKIGSELLFID